VEDMMPKKGLKKKKAYKAATYAKAREGMMNNATGNYEAISRFTKDGMRDGYCAGYRISV
jgi:hypothetical protein